jgi:hypothetical protein
MPVALRVREPLQHQHPDTLTPPGPVRSLRKRLAPPVTSQTPLPRKLSERPGVAITVTPPASAIEHSPDRNACAAKCIAVNDDEHAVSTDTAGPCNPKQYDTRPDATLAVVPVNTRTRRPPAPARYPDAMIPA